MAASDGEQTAQDVIDAMRVAVAARQTSIVQTIGRLLDAAPETNPTRPMGPVLDLLREDERKEADERGAI